MDVFSPWQSLRTSRELYLMDLSLCSSNHNFRISYHHIWTSRLIPTHNRPVFEGTVQIPGLLILTSLTLLYKWEFNYTHMKTQFLDYNCQWLFLLGKIYLLPSYLSFWFQRCLEYCLLIPVSCFSRLKGYNYLIPACTEAIAFLELPDHPSLYLLWFFNTLPKMMQPDMQHVRQDQTIHLNSVKMRSFPFSF